MYNGHGDVMGITDSTGAVTKTYDYDYDKSYVYYYENKNAKRMAGTSLVRRVIDHKNMCTIISVDGTRTGIRINGQDSQNPAKGSYAKIEVDFDSPETYWVNNGGNYVEQVSETYIEMGHELIHALRAMNGNMKHYIDGTYGPPWRDRKTSTTDTDKLDTVGINYFGSDGGCYPASTWAMTENTLRRENGLPPRVDYGR